MIRIFKRLPGVIFMVLLLGLAGKEALSHQRTYSPVEKRELQTRPEISITKVLDGRFQRKYESYLRDQFPGRDHWVSFQTDMELFMGKNEIHNVYIGKNHYLLEHYTEKEFDPQQISKNLQALEKFVGKPRKNPQTIFPATSNTTSINNQFIVIVPLLFLRLIPMYNSDHPIPTIRYKAAGQTYNGIYGCCVW